MNLFLQLHKHNYDVAEALKALVPTTGPMLWFQWHQKGLFTLEVNEEYHRVLFYVEDDGSVRPAEKDKGHGGREQAQAGLRARLHQ